MFLIFFIFLKIYYFNVQKLDVYSFRLSIWDQLHFTPSVI